MDNSIIQQGRFTATGGNITIPLRSGVDWMTVYNTTIGAAAQTTAVGVKYYWQRGFPAGAKWTTFKSQAASAADLEQYITSNGFTLVDSSDQVPGLLKSLITGISNASIPVVTNSSTNGLAAGNVVRLINVTGAQQISGVDFTVGYNTLSTTTFSLDYMAAIVTASGAGSWRQIKYDPIFYPRSRTITKITKAVNAVVTMSVTHGYLVGQEVRIHVPADFGMTEMDGLSGTIVAINTTTTSGNTITLDIDSSAFTTFAWPLTSNQAFSLPQVVPVGQDTAFATAEGVDVLSDATLNEAFIGITLQGGASCPGGAASDVVYWVAGTSSVVDNQ